jgi:hypothetical protein
VTMDYVIDQFLSPASILLDLTDYLPEAIPNGRAIRRYPQSIPIWWVSGTLEANVKFDLELSAS